jgi:hypothetical protein
MALKRFFYVTFLFATTYTGCNGSHTSNNNQSSKHNEKIMALNTNENAASIMNEDDFWKLIDKSREPAKNNYQKQIGSLKEILLTLHANEIERFNNRFISLLDTSYNWNLWGAAYVINGGCSEDCFDYFRHYLIAHGKEKFYNTLNDPESCVSWIKSEEEDDWEGLQYCAPEAYEEKTGKEIPISYQPAFQLKGTPFDEETVFDQYPKLAKKFMDN